MNTDGVAHIPQWLAQDQAILAHRREELRYASSRLSAAVIVSTVVGALGIAGWTLLTLVVVSVAMAIPTTATSVMSGVIVTAVLAVSAVGLTAISLMPSLWAAYNWYGLSRVDVDAVQAAQERVRLFGQSGVDPRMHSAVQIARFLKSNGHGEVAGQAMQHLTDTLNHSQLLREARGADAQADQAFAELDARATEVVARLADLALAVSRQPSLPVEHLTEATHDALLRNRAAREVRASGARSF